MPLAPTACGRAGSERLSIPGIASLLPIRWNPTTLCPFGKWLQALPASDRNSEHFKKVQPLHTAFHKEAAKVLKLALKGNKKEADQCMASGGSYLVASSKLTEAMMDWRKALVSRTH